MAHVKRNGFDVDRPLTDQERTDHLSLKKPAKSKPMGEHSIIKMNSTYLECVDDCFRWRGTLTTLMFIMACISAWGAMLGFSFASADWQRGDTGSAFFMAFMALIPVGTVVFCVYYIFKECFRLTHYPIRFNRKNRKVYIYRLDGTTLTLKWENIYFTVCRYGSAVYRIYGHLLYDDSKTVCESFALPGSFAYDVNAKEPTLWTFWEFVRRYMEGSENEVKKLLPEIGRTLNIADKKEGFIQGFVNAMHEIFAFPLFFVLLCVPIFVLAIGRRFAMLTSKIPQWSQEIEAECAIEPNDPYLVDETHPPPTA